MSHTALARTYRPRRFAEVTAQAHVSETLRRAVASGRVGHAYLFCGPRGVGKTTLARVLAMALNCADRTPEGEPCGSCEDCRRIWGGTTSLDVVEIDAASNRGVEDARDLRDRAMYAPSDENRSKVYIVDEAHMLTREAWNALLKILEEPPPRVHFIFATTEPQKIGQTAAPILSRCQRFDFRRVAVADIVARLSEILRQEGLAASDEALRLIARKADGGMRDALSILDQVLSLSEGEVTAEAVGRVLGVVEEERYLELFDLLAARDHAGIFRFVEARLDEGTDLVEFYHGLLEALRTLLRLRVGGEAPEMPSDGARAWARRAEGFEPADLVRMLGMGAELETEGSLRRTTQPRVLLELLLLRWSFLDRSLDLESLLGALGGAPEGHDPGSGGAAGRSSSFGASSTTTRGPVEGRGAPPSGGPAPSTIGLSGGGDPPSTDDSPGSTGDTPSMGDPAGKGGSPPTAALLPDPGREAGPERSPGTASDLDDAGAPPPDRAPGTGLTEHLRAAGIEPPGGSSRRGTRPEPTRSEVDPGPPAPDRPGSTDASGRPEPSGPASFDALRSALRTEEGHGAPRISPDDVRAGRLRDLLAKEPGLGPAVRELDLELLDPSS